MELENGASFSVETLLENAGFRAWVLNNDQEQSDSWNNYLEQHPEQREVIGQARQLLLDLQAEMAAHDLSEDTVEKRLQAQLKQLGSPEKLGETGARLRWISGYRLAAAASVALLLLAGIVWWIMQPGAVQYATNYGEWENVELPDGSQVRLNANTRLQLDEHWDAADTRRVWLSGEAYFQVAEKPETQSRFQVITDDLTVEVLGTTFNVRNRDAQTEVFLEEGRVSLELQTDSIRKMQLEPGQKVAYSSARNEILDNNFVSAELTTSWKDGLLKFDKTPMREVLRTVEEIYGITFRVEDAKQYDRPITSQGVPMEQLEVTLPILARALGLTVTLENEIYVIK